MKEGKETVLEPKVNDWKLSANREHWIVRQGNEYRAGEVGNAATKKDIGEVISFDKMAARVEPMTEWTQIFATPEMVPTFLRSRRRRD
jgi:hypothetical protein